MKLSIVTPVYNEEENILKVLDGVSKNVKTDHEVLIIYDYQDDPTCKVVNEYCKKNPKSNIRLVRNSMNDGRGFLNALRSGFKSARGEAVVTMMADMCDDPRDIDKMYKKFKNGADLVCASRYMPGGKQIGSPWLKRTLSKGAGTSLFYLGRLPIRDATNNFKLYNKQLLNMVSFDNIKGFEIAMAITVQAHKKNLTISEIPTTWQDRTAGEAKFNVKKMVPLYIRWYKKALL